MNGLAACFLLVSFTATALAQGEPRTLEAARWFRLEQPSRLSSPLSLWATHYYVHQAEEQLQGIPLLGTDGNPISGLLKPHDWCMGAMQGSIRVKSATGEKTFNFLQASGRSQVDCAEVLRIDSKKKKWITATGKSLFGPAKGPFGDGVKSFVLVPGRTIAVDQRKIPYGSIIFVPQARGIDFITPSGEKRVHDGYFFAGDKGGGVEDDHIDVFCGDIARNCFPSFIKSKNSHRIEAFAVATPGIAEAMQQLHAPR